MQAAQNSSDWSATLHSDRLNVHAQFTFPAQGYKVNLRKKEPQGLNPAILLLEKTVIAPRTVQPSSSVAMLLSFEQHVTPECREVEILPDRIRIKVNQARTSP
jgi:hypothetical protein